MNPCYRYSARVVSVYDGDTLRCDLSLGFDVKLMNRQIRLLGINAPEMTGNSRTQGEASRDRLRQLVLDKDIVVETVKDKTEKYGRYLGRAYVSQDGVSICVNDLLISEGLATPYMT